MLDVVMTILNTGAVGAMLIMTWRLMVLKDRKSYAATKEHRDDLKKLHESSVETIAEVTSALVSKNHTDEKMALAVDKLAEQLRQLKELLKEKKL